MFTDRAKIKFIAGKGGNGIVSWRREKYIPKGGPAGGNGGVGASIILQADAQVFSLEWFRNRHIIKAESGQCGGSSRKQGRKGQDLILKVPCGTLIHDASGQEIYDFTHDGDTFTLCQGGRGGRGNATFATPTNRAPTKCTEGKIGEEKEVKLELKLIADIGLVGFPNGGKSTLIDAMTNARVKIAPYPFTTLRPNLGFIELEDYTRILMADIPGIIDGAHVDKGLGLEFLRHIERTHMLIYVLDGAGIDGRDPLSDFQVLQHELKKYNPEILKKPFLVVFNKLDEEISQEFLNEFKKDYKEDLSKLIPISALYKKGLKELLIAIRKNFT